MAAAPARQKTIGTGTTRAPLSDVVWITPLFTAVATVQPHGVRLTGGAALSAYNQLGNGRPAVQTRLASRTQRVWRRRLATVYHRGGCWHSSAACPRLRPIVVTGYVCAALVRPRRPLERHRSDASSLAMGLPDAVSRGPLVHSWVVGRRLAEGVVLATWHPTRGRAGCGWNAPRVVSAVA